MTFDLIDLMIWCIFAIIIGWKLREYMAVRFVKKHLKRTKQEQSSKESDSIWVDIFKEGDIFYVYNAEDNKFLIQVKTKDELIEFFKAKFPNKNILTSESNMALFETL